MIIQLFLVRYTQALHFTLDFTEAWLDLSPSTRYSNSLKVAGVRGPFDATFGGVLADLPVLRMTLIGLFTFSASTGRGSGAVQPTSIEPLKSWTNDTDPLYCHLGIGFQFLPFGLQ
jgi:hypothetical protein